MRISVFEPHIKDAVGQSGKRYEQVLEAVRSFGVEGVEADVASLREDAKGFRAKLDAADLAVASVYANYNFEDACDMEQVKRDVALIAESGCRKFLVIPGFIRPAQEGMRDVLLERILLGLRQTTECAVAAGLTVSLEDYDNSIAPFSTIEGLDWFFQRVEHLGFTFDTGNFLYSEQSALDAFARLGDKLVHVHCKDRSLTPITGEQPLITTGGRALYTAPVGHGCIPMAECVRLVKSTGYDGWISVEHFGSRDQLGYTQQSAAWLRKAWQDMG